MTLQCESARQKRQQTSLRPRFIRGRILEGQDNYWAERSSLAISFSIHANLPVDERRQFDSFETAPLRKFAGTEFAGTGCLSKFAGTG